MRNNFSAGKILNDLAERKGWTKEQLAGILDIAPSNLYKKLKMKDLDTKFLRSAADAAGMDMKELFTLSVTQNGKINTFGDSTVNYKTTTNDDRILIEQVKGLERENDALKQQIITLNKLINMYENGK
jgi:transcriptional regulator with XRE-family HTH domain